MKAPLPLTMGWGGRLVAFEALLFLNLFCFQRRYLVTCGRCVVGRGLECQAPLFVSNICRLVCNLPIGADRHGVALVTASRRRDAFPGSEHSATFKDQQSCQKHRHEKLHGRLHFRMSSYVHGMLAQPAAKIQHSAYRQPVKGLTASDAAATCGNSRFDAFDACHGI